MAHDPRREDYQRLALRFVRTIDPQDPAAAREFAGFGHRFAQDRDSLPQTDADRAFHLVCVATELIDYKLPFADAAQAAELIRRGQALLDEALSLDPGCFDARRMKSGPEAPGLDSRHEFLAGLEPEVRAACEQARDVVDASEDEERVALGRSLAMRPYWRWLAALAEGALICGRNHEAISWCERLLESDPADTCDVRFTYAYALAKLEDEKGLDELEARYARISPTRGPDDAWMLLARMALAHKACRMQEAQDLLARVCRTYPEAPATLLRQTELPDGEFARLCVAPYSADELILAVSEGIVLLQEGADRTGRGVLGAWVAAQVAKGYPRIAMQVAAEMRQEGAESR